MEEIRVEMTQMGEITWRVQPTVRVLQHLVPSAYPASSTGSLSGPREDNLRNLDSHLSG